MIPDPSDERYLKMLQRYPTRYGKLAGIYLNLLDEVTSHSNFPTARIQFYIEQLKTIDKPTEACHNPPPADETPQVKQA